MKTIGGREGAEVHVLWQATASSRSAAYRGHGGHGDSDYGVTLLEWSNWWFEVVE